MVSVAKVILVGNIGRKQGGPPSRSIDAYAARALRVLAGLERAFVNGDSEFLRQELRDDLRHLLQTLERSYLPCSKLSQAERESLLSYREQLLHLLDRLFRDPPLHVTLQAANLQRRLAAMPRRARACRTHRRRVSQLRACEAHHWLFRFGYFLPASAALIRLPQKFTV